jgi:hypoxanthine phosphoribosyltransferase
MVDKTYVSWDKWNSYMGTITREMAKTGYRPDVILGPGRGGYTGGVMLSHYYEVPFEGFRWQTRDGDIKDAETLNHILTHYVGKNILIFDDINDSGATLQGINDEVEKLPEIYLHGEVKYATIFAKESSNFDSVHFRAVNVLPDEENWIVFPYEDWWV